MEEEKKAQVMKIRQAAKELGISAKEIRYFLRRGLVPQVKRARNGYRELADWQVDWIRTLVWLKKCGMSLEEMKRYVWLCRRGKETIAERKALLETKKRQLWQVIEEAQGGIDFIERREEIFDEFLANKRADIPEWI